MSIALNTVEEALTYLDQLNKGGLVEEYCFKGELAQFSIAVNGDRYKATVPGELARGLWEVQEALYKAAAFAITGADDIRRLSPQQRQGLELVFKVSEGSTDLKAAAIDFLKTVAEGLKNMNDRAKAIVIISIVIVAVGGTVAWKALETNGETKKAEIEASLKLKTEQERTETLRVVGEIAQQSSIVQRFEKATEEGAKALMRSAPDAESLKFGRAKFHRTDIEEVNQRAPRTPSTAIVYEGEFRVFGAEFRSKDMTKYVLADEKGVEFPVTIQHSDMSEADQDRLWTAMKTRSLIKLEVSLIKSRGAIKAANIITVL